MFTAAVNLYYTIMFVILAATLATVMFNMIMFFVVSRLADKAVNFYPNNREVRRGRWTKTVHKGRGVGKHMRQVGKYSPF